MNLFTDGTTAATKDEAETYITELVAEEIAV